MSSETALSSKSCSIKAIFQVTGLLRLSARNSGNLSCFCLPNAGCGVKHLWDRLRQRLPVAGLPGLDDSLKRYIWALLMECPQDVGVVHRLPDEFAR